MLITHITRLLGFITMRVRVNYVRSHFSCTRVLTYVACNATSVPMFLVLMLPVECSPVCSSSSVMRSRVLFRYFNYFKLVSNFSTF
jgi:hypothetical protein